MTHAAEAEMARNLAALRAAPRPMEVVHDVPLAEYVFLNWDKDEADVRARLVPEEGALVSVEAEVTGAPRWFSLSVALGDQRFAEGEVVGLALSARAGAPFSMAPFLRIGGGPDERNSRFGDAIGIGEADSVAVRLLPLGWREADGVARHAMVILPLPKESFRFTLVNMRLFVLPAGQAQDLAAPALGGQAV